MNEESEHEREAARVLLAAGMRQAGFGPGREDKTRCSGFTLSPARETVMIMVHAYDAQEPDSRDADEEDLRRRAAALIAVGWRVKIQRCELRAIPPLHREIGHA